MSCTKFRKINKNDYFSIFHALFYIERERKRKRERGQGCVITSISKILSLPVFPPVGTHEFIEHIDLFLKAIEQIRNKIQFFRILSFDWQDDGKNSDIDAY